VPAIETLKRRDEFRRLFRQGRRVEEGALALRHVSVGGFGPRFGFQIKKKRATPSPGTA